MVPLPLQAQGEARKGPVGIEDGCSSPGRCEPACGSRSTTAVLMVLVVLVVLVFILVVLVVALRRRVKGAVVAVVAEKLILDLLVLRREDSI